MDQHKGPLVESLLDCCCISCALCLYIESERGTAVVVLVVVAACLQLDSVSIRKCRVREGQSCRHTHCYNWRQVLFKGYRSLCYKSSKGATCGDPETLRVGEKALEGSFFLLLLL